MNWDADEISHDRIVRLMVGRDIKSLYVESTAAKTPGYLKVRDMRSSRYPQKRVSFDASRGEILGFAGLVGAGRSEMAKAMVGLDPRGGGQVTLGERGLVDSSRRGTRRPAASTSCPRIGAPRA